MMLLLLLAVIIISTIHVLIRIHINTQFLKLTEEMIHTLNKQLSVQIKNCLKTMIVETLKSSGEFRGFLKTVMSKTLACFCQEKTRFPYLFFIFVFYIWVVGFFVFTILEQLVDRL